MKLKKPAFTAKSGSTNIKIRVKIILQALALFSIVYMKNVSSAITSCLNDKYFRESRTPNWWIQIRYTRVLFISNSRSLLPLVLDNREMA